MKCMFLRGVYINICAADVRNYVPSDFEIGEYCETGRYKICPLYMAAQGRMQGGMGRVPDAGPVPEPHKVK